MGSDLRAQGAAPPSGRARISPARRARPALHPRGRGRRTGHRPPDPRSPRCPRAGLGRRPRSHPHHPAPRLLAALPAGARVDGRRRGAERSPPRRAREPADPAPRRRVLLGRLLALQHALPTRRRGTRRLRRRHRDGRAPSPAQRRPANPRPRHRRGEHRRGALRCHRRGAGARHGPGRRRRGAAPALRTALVRPDQRGRLRSRPALPDGGAAAVAQRSRLRRRGGRGRRPRGRVPAPAPTTGRRAGPPRAHPQGTHRARGAGEPGATAARGPRTLPDGTGGEGGRACLRDRGSTALAQRRLRAHHRRCTGGAARPPRAGRAVPPGARPSLVPLRGRRP
jgi:hypothetical protein